MTTYHPQPHLPQLLSYALVAPRTRVLYVPTTKVACSTLKLFLAQVEGTHDPAASERIISPNISQEQTIHNHRVHGLTRFFDLQPRRQWEILQSPEWLRIGALRDPLRRAYSSWENRVLLRAPGTPEVVFERCPDVLVDGRIDMVATFSRFAHEIAADLGSFMADDHFRPQFNTLYCDQFEYHHLVRVDVPGELQRLADTINERAGTRVPLARLNSGLGIRPEQVYDRESADLIAATYAEDYRWFSFEAHSYTGERASLVLDPLQQALLDGLRATTERLRHVSRAAYDRVGIRYGLAQIGRAVAIRLTRPGARRDRRLLQ